MANIRQVKSSYSCFTPFVVQSWVITGEPSVNRKDLRALTLVGPTRDNLLLDTLPVLDLDNRLHILNIQGDPKTGQVYFSIAAWLRNVRIPNCLNKFLWASSIQILAVFMCSFGNIITLRTFPHAHYYIEHLNVITPYPC